MPRLTDATWGAIALALITAFTSSASAQTASCAAEKEPLPSIECPLRKARIDSTKLRPTEDVERYIQFLERPDRAKWQKPDEVIKALGLTGSETVVDLGAGSGYFTFRLANTLPKGKVVAVDTQPEMIRHVQHKAASERITNIEPRIAKPDDPCLPREAALVFICDVLHHVPNRSEWLRKLHAEMRGGARLAIIEFKSGRLPEGPPEVMKIAKSDLIALLTKAGFALKEDCANLLPYQEMLVFEKP
jgi:2-polyprenyl-3-methyl-5-hydroxy-6-metoxy-1,4-benzoquinol methylase